MNQKRGSLSDHFEWLNQEEKIFRILESYIEEVKKLTKEFEK